MEHNSPPAVTDYFTAMKRQATKVAKMRDRVAKLLIDLDAAETELRALTEKALAKGAK